ncbi:glycosyltransferase family 39 protein [Candidatus Microgenomates bacterium]|nr:glycosyltransferase family 39 protein [Candidatus Microgenomates bacterium]
MKFFFCILFLSGIFIRLYQVKILPAYYGDELAFGYSAYSILKSGSDEHGKFLPLILQSFGDHKLALYSYLTIPYVAIFGLFDWVFRLPAIILGLLTIPLVYLSINKFLKDKRIALIAAFLVLISPCHIIFSRNANEVVPQVFMIIAFFYFWLEYQSSKKKLFLCLSILFLILATICYYSSFVFIPLFTLFIGICGYLEKKKDIKLHFLPFFISIITLLFLISTQPLSRINQTSIFNHGEIQSSISESLGEDQGIPYVFVSRFFHNKVYTSFILLISNFFKHFTFDFLFLKGDSGYNRFSVPYTGVLYLFELPFLLIGVSVSIYKIIKKKSYRHLMLVVWIGISFIAESFSFMGTNIQRVITFIPAIQAVTAIGVINLWAFLSNKKFIVKSAIVIPLICLFIYNYLSFIHAYFVHQPKHQPWERVNWGREFVETMNELSPKYQKTVMTETPLELFLVYNQIVPTQARKLLADKYADNMGFYHYNLFGDILIMPKDCPQMGKLNTLYVCKGERVPANSKILKVLRFGDGLPARVFLEFIDPKEIKTNQQILPERLKIIPETQENPQILPAKEDIYWESN